MCANQVVGQSLLRDASYMSVDGDYCRVQTRFRLKTGPIYETSVTETYFGRVILHVEMGWILPTRDLVD